MDSADLKFRRSMESYINSYVDMSKKIQNEFREVRGELLRYLDAILTSIRSSYLKNTSRNQIERLIKLIDKAKKQLNAFFYRIQLNTENGKASCLIKQYRQQLYYFNCTASNNSLPNSFDESDHFISGSLQNSARAPRSLGWKFSGMFPFFKHHEIIIADLQIRMGSGILLLPEERGYFFNNGIFRREKSHCKGI